MEAKSEGKVWDMSQESGNATDDMAQGSRGVFDDMAKKMKTLAFLSDILDNMNLEVRVTVDVIIPNGLGGDDDMHLFHWSGVINPSEDTLIVVDED